MKRSLLYIFCCSALQGLLGQNLVTNGSFEDYSQCPFSDFQIDFANGWSSFRSSSDYFHVCSGATEVGVPFNTPGYQHAADGSGYAGIHTFSGDNGNPLYYREYIGSQLLGSLQIGMIYYVSAKFSWTPWSTFESIYAHDKLGVRFSTHQYFEDSNDPVPNQAHVYTEDIISDSMGWTTVSGSFVADSSYMYVVIGNFFDDTQTEWLALNPNGTLPLSFYYVDDICVSLDSATCDMATGITETTEIDVQVYPNPTSGQVIVELGGLAQNELNFELYDSSGRRPIPTIAWQNGARLCLGLTGHPSGVYLLRMEFGGFTMLETLIKQ